MRAGKAARRDMNVFTGAIEVPGHSVRQREHSGYVLQPALVKSVVHMVGLICTATLVQLRASV
jgi:hypothetical protein